MRSQQAMLSRCQFESSFLSKMLLIDNLPTEIICHIFDKFTGRERRSLRLVCQRWNEILKTKHFIERRMLKVVHENLNLLTNCAKFTCICIQDCFSVQNSVNRRLFLNSLQSVIFLQEVIDHIEELTLKDVQSDLLQELFGETCGVSCRLPNLKSLNICWFEFFEFPQLRVWNFSKNLTKLHITISKTEELRIVECVANQLVELFLESNKLRLLLDCCNIADFEKLQILKLKSDSFFPDRFYNTSDIGERFGRALGRLRCLGIGFRHNDFILGYAPMFRLCQRLQSLSIVGADLSQDACNAIAGLHGLRKLELLMRIDKSPSLMPWNLQNLEILHTYVENLAPIGDNLPALNTIRISNHTVREGRFSVRPSERLILQRYLSHFQSITKLFLYDIYLEDDLLSRFPSMPKIREIVLRCVRTSSLILDTIYERAPQVFKVYFWDCCFLTNPRAKIPTFAAFCLLLPRAGISHSSSKIIEVDYEQILS